MTVATILVMIGLVFSKCSGFLRDIFVNIRFSDPVYRDSFTLAFTIPDLVYNLLIGGSIQSAITPSLSASISKGEEDKGFRAVNIFISVFSMLLLVLCILGVIFAEPIYRIYSAGDKHPETVHLAAMASKWLFPQIFFMMLAALCIGILNAYKRFGSTAFGPTIYNIFVLLAIVLLAGNSEKMLVNTTCGIMGAAVIYFLFQYFIGFDKLKKFRFIFKPGDKDFRQLVRRALPILFSASIVQINMVILNYFANSFPDSGHIYALRNASTTWQLPYGIFAVAIGNVMLPSLAALYSAKEYDKASELLSSRLKSALFLTIPSAGFMLIMSSDIIKAIFQWRPTYTDADVRRAALFLCGYCAAIITHTVVFIMNQAFYAIGKTKIPLLAGCCGLITNPLFCTAFIELGAGPMSLTLAYSLTSLIQMTILVVLYRRDKRLAPGKLLAFLIKSCAATMAMCFVVLIIDRAMPGAGSKISQLITLAEKCAVAVVLYFGLAIIMKMPEATYWIDKIKGKVKGRMGH